MAKTLPIVTAKARSTAKRTRGMGDQPSKPRAYSYIRFSSPEQALGDSLRRQTEAAKEYAARRGLILDDELTFRDLGMPAFRGQNAERGGLAHFRFAVQHGDVAAGSYLLIESFDRLSRMDPWEALPIFQEIINAGITIVTMQDNKEWSRESIRGNPWRILESLIVMMRAHEESATKSQRLSAVYEEKRKRAATKADTKPFTRQLPAWLFWDEKTKKFKVHPERAKIVRAIFQKTVSGWGQHRIAHWLNEQGIPTWGGPNRKGERWHRSYIKKILVNASVVGTFTPHRALRDDTTGVRKRKPLASIEGYFPVVVDKVVFDQIAIRLATTSPRGRHANRPPQSMFSGVLKCSRCDGTVSRISKGAHVYLVCATANAKAGTCKYQAVRYADVEEVFRAHAEAICADAPRGKDTSDIEADIDNQRALMDRLEDDARELADELLTNRSNAVRRKLREVENHHDEAEKKLSTLVARRDTLTSASVRRRLDALQQSLQHEPFNVVTANAALKLAARKVVMDVEQASLEIHWHHVEPDEPPQHLNFYSKHKRWGGGVDFAAH